jgi:hypothetical protein
LPWEITASSRWIEFQNELTTKEYAALMSDNVEDITELRLWSLEKIKENKAKVARAYNKKVKPKEFQVGDLVGKRCYHWGLRMRHMVNGLRIGTGLIELIKLCQGMHTCSKN